MEDLKVKPIDKPILLDFEDKKFEPVRDSEGGLVGLNLVTQRPIEKRIAIRNEKIEQLTAGNVYDEGLLKEFK